MEINGSFGRVWSLRRTTIPSTVALLRLRVRPESFDGISMTCSVAGDRYSWYAANKAKQFQWQHPWWYPQVIEMAPNVSGQTLRKLPRPGSRGVARFGC